MNSTHLSKRLQAVSDHVESGSRLADIGSDHAYLPIYLAKNHIISYGVVGEVPRDHFQTQFLKLKRQLYWLSCSPGWLMGSLPFSLMIISTSSRLLEWVGT
ncbi:hypothetical protein HMPREF9104_02712 [Lentilactobacillus kisonensis F0435]|uniref:Uncharacterized protein n=1 Tax=Lentilactobacillus kisonensis F0435 TaxID=797516 RepID=H1LJC0_9LACO|nr:hypothetical protein HMPREF9104_02712 [Lentilactobacillus kisonensis F0435]